MKEYKIAKGWAILIWIMGPFLICLFGAMIISPLTGWFDDDAREGYGFFVLIGIPMIIFLVIGMIDSVKARFIVGPDYFDYYSTFSKRHLSFSEVKGFTTDENYTWIYPLDKSKKKMKIGKYVGKRDELIAFLRENFVDLDQKQVEEEREEILQNAEFGVSEEERSEKLDFALKLTKYLNIAGVAIAVWTLFIARPYQYCMLASTVFPLACVAFLWMYRGMIRINSKGGYPNVIAALFVPSAGLFLRGMIDYNFLHPEQLIAPALGTGVVLSLVCLAATRELRFNGLKFIGPLFLTLLGFTAYGSGATAFINCYYDRSPATEYQTEVFDKSVSKGKTTSYNLYLGPWGERSEAENVDVSQQVYEYFDIGDTVGVYQQKGALGITWFEVGETVDKL